jgi:hypothetical protein
MVFLVIGKMGSELIDSCRQKSNLYFGRAGVGSSPPKFLDNFLFTITVERHQYLRELVAIGAKKTASYFTSGRH